MLYGLDLQPHCNLLETCTPFTCNDGSSCSIVVNSEVGQEMKTVDLFVLNEASVISCLVLQVIGR